MAKGNVSIVVGDVGTCKTNAAVMSRSAAFQWVGLCPGDLHNKGYFSEACFKAHGSSGMHYILYTVLNRKKLSKEVFKERKFNDHNLTLVREGINDGCRAYGLASVFEFKRSDMFPNQAELLSCKQRTGSHTEVVLQKFKAWLKSSASADVAFNHRATAFHYFGPLLSLKAINCYPINGKGQESGVLPSNFMNAYEKGKQKIEEKFTEKLYDAFPDARYSILNRPL
eukprot:Seg185.3 transcript_id=Seg185.3/GoldUCD/mRNA.D3Y31 product="hypothetical protein" protein_id=Seg185.3/GoldUCD/D3Y31